MTESLEKILAGEKKYRLKQIEAAKFDPRINNFSEISTLSKELREKLKSVPWLSVKLAVLQESRIDNTKKAILELSDGMVAETVLMGRKMKKKIKNAEERYTICVSSQVGCAMGCSFCATGIGGFKRNLSAEEIIDQFRFWQRWLCVKNGKIDNVVFMGQGEPLLNYDEVKQAIIILLKNTEIGPTKITLSTAGIMSSMEKILTDIDFPPVRVAISLHSAVNETRKKIMPSHQNNFFEFLPIWAKKYHEKFSSRTHFLGLEYLLLDSINDDEKHLKVFIKLASKVGRVRINLIPYNAVGGSLRGSKEEVIKHWHNILMKSGFTTTIRHSQGADIDAACGQLANKMANC
ncbi:MAG: hypothetical protein COU29_03860 [Candidatus Magasanikbacteria bacterium CG10_big_fil_rev_8_21_14_0_10_36_32]|uniref:Radical SAM core domain-containing protein n=1 Tax=Candidatus Magasanikbacteria bacterium CG10_big_fil_rev_8_21_14_0_10_36_32 TaxID=1974646 RepID=A0A2M6W5V5_9BACT|nr:MAG: hypothetical protein COU29_03860 [Candidatus Magasanikbacteria bacterium CG10_big_fil_rev_8_21_14_0_10_36_32]